MAPSAVGTATVTPRPKARKSLEPWIRDSVEYYDHQIVGIRWMARRRNFLCADDMGLGKSVQALTVFAMDVFTGKGETALVVCPVSLKGNWSDEIQKFSTFPHIVLGVEEDPNKPGRMKKLDKTGRTRQLLEFMGLQGPKILICNYEQVASHLQLLVRMDFHMRIFDEAHYLQNWKAKRTEACMAVPATRTGLLTGTPMLGQVDGLWPLLNMIDRRHFPNRWTFVNRYAVFGGYEGKSIVGIKNEKELQTKMEPLMIRRLKEEVLDLQEPRVIPRRVDLSPEQEKLYMQLAEDDELTMVDFDDPVEVNNALTKFLRYKQICATTATVLGLDNDSSYKLDLAVEDALGLVRADEKVVTFTQFRPAIECLKRRLVKVGIPVWELHGDVPAVDRQDLVKTWGSSRYHGVLVCQIQVAGVGLNMTQSRNCQFIDKSFTPGINDQAVDRLNRIGQDSTQPVDVYEYIVRGTVEQRVEAILRQKRRVQEIIEVEDYKRQLLTLLMNKGP